jgi:hypothetical protein
VGVVLPQSITVETTEIRHQESFLFVIIRKRFIFISKLSNGLKSRRIATTFERRSPQPSPHQGEGLYCYHLYEAICETIH